MSNEINIRKAKLTDLKAIVEIYNQAVEIGQKTADTVPVTLEDYEKRFREHLPEKHPIFVATQNNIILGYLSISPYRPGRMALKHTAEVSYYVQNDYHRRGIATKLLTHAIKICPSLQIKTLFAILLDSNQASVKLLEKFRFKKWGHMPRVAEFGDVEVGHLYYGLRIAE